MTDPRPGDPDYEPRVEGKFSYELYGDDELEFPDYETMEQTWVHRARTSRTLDSPDSLHPLWSRAMAEGWTDQFYPDVELYKAQGEIQYGIWHESLFASDSAFQQVESSGRIRDPYSLGWRGAINGEGLFWKHFDTLGDALDAFRDRNFRGFERLLPDPNNTIDSDYEQVFYAFAIARGESPE